MLPAAFAPLRHPVFRALWLANGAAGLGSWMQSTGAAWMMATLDPDPLMVSLVQAATLLPVFLFALPAGALADIVDRRLFLIGAQLFMLVSAALLAVMTALGWVGPWLLLMFTFLVGAGSAAAMPAWAATVPETVPRDDLVPALALNAIGFNLTRATGPALAGLLLGVTSPAVAFGLNAVSFLGVVTVLALWRRETPKAGLPKEHLLSAIRAGLRFVSATPPMRAAILRAMAFFAFAAAPWGLLPLVVKDRLQMGPEAFGLFLGLMGAGAVTGGLALPRLRDRFARDRIVFGASLLSALSVLVLGVVPHALAVATAMFAFGICWLTAASTLQAAAQLAAPGWVRARALGIYQLCFFGALALGSTLWGWVATLSGVQWSLAIAGIGGILTSLAARAVQLDRTAGARGVVVEPVAPPAPEPPAPELATALPHMRGRVLEVVRYVVPQQDRAAFLAAMVECERVRRRAGAAAWQLCEDVAHPEQWLEAWIMDSWTDHLREPLRLTEEDQAVLAAAYRFNRGDAPPFSARYLAIDPKG